MQGDRLGAAEEDRAGAAILAQLLRVDLLPEAWIAPPQVRQLRAVLRHWAQLVRLRTLLRNRIHAVLADHGRGRSAGCWSGRAASGWPTRRCLGSPARSQADGLALMDALQEPIGRLDQEVRQRTKANPRVKVLTQLPGVSLLAALVLLHRRRLPSGQR